MAGQCREKTFKSQMKRQCTFTVNRFLYDHREMFRIRCRSVGGESPVGSRLHRGEPMPVVAGQIGHRRAGICDDECRDRVDADVTFNEQQCSTTAADGRQPCNTFTVGSPPCGQDVPFPGISGIEERRRMPIRISSSIDVPPRTAPCLAM